MSGSSDFVLIGAGLPRTGTMSLQAALKEILGPTYHMKELFGAKGTSDADFWNQALKRRVSSEGWKSFISERKLRSGVDYPFSFYWRDLMRIYPEAKVILTVRSPEAWYSSVKGTISKFAVDHLHFPDSWLMGLMGKTKHSMACHDVCVAIPNGFDFGMFDAITEGKEKAAEFYNKWVEEVKAEVPKERLLVFEVKDGWEPLCKFLDVPVPKIPFPRINDSVSMQKERAKFKRTAYVVAFFALAGVAGLAAAGLSYIFF